MIYINKFILEELSKCKKVDFIIDEKHNKVIIKKSNKVFENFKFNIIYILELDDSLLKETGSVLETNWNDGVVPKSKYLAAQLKQHNSNVYCFFARGFDINNNIYLDDIYDNLWLPKNKFFAIGELG